MPCPLPRRTRQVRVSVASPSARPSPKLRRVGVRDFTFEAYSGFTHVTACRIAQSPEATFVTRLRPGRLPLRTARQLPAQPTSRWVEPSSTGKPRRLGALSFTGASWPSLCWAERRWTQRLRVQRHARVRPELSSALSWPLPYRDSLPDSMSSLQRDCAVSRDLADCRSPNRQKRNSPQINTR